MVEIGAISSANTNLVTGGAASAASATTDLSFSPYPGSKNSTNTEDATISFDDFLDMINPLQHIPVVSSVYRAVTGETISPLSRIAGDALYGGIMGLASAGLAALGAIGDEALTASNGGQSVTSSVIASLFGDDKAQDTQLAATDAPATDNGVQAAPQLQVASLQTPAPQQSPILQIPTFPDAPQPEAVAQTTAAPELAAQPESAQQSPAPAAPMATASGESSGVGKGMPLDRTKLPYGGIMDTAMLQNAQQNQTLALAMTGSANTLHTQHNLRNSRFTTANTATAAPQVQNAPQTEAALQNMLTELQAMKGVNQYKNAAQSTPVPGSALNITN